MKGTNTVDGRSCNMQDFNATTMDPVTNNGSSTAKQA
jgi:hypothetical protein